MVEKLPLILSIEKTLRRETNAEGWPVFGFEVKTQSGPAILRLTPAALDQLKEMLIKDPSSEDEAWLWRLPEDDIAALRGLGTCQRWQVSK
jgi:hypothetical protein